jgi:hypothetical protein
VVQRPDRWAALAACLLDFEEFPGRYPLALRAPRLLFDHGTEVLTLASGRVLEGLPDDAVLQARLRQAARFFVRTAMLRPGVDHYTLMGLTPAFELATLRAHYRMLMRLTHPDFVDDERAWPPDAATRINQANDVLSSTVSRQQYARRHAGGRQWEPSAREPSAVRRSTPAPARTGSNLGRRAVLATVAVTCLLVLGVWVASGPPDAEPFVSVAEADRARVPTPVPATPAPPPAQALPLPVPPPVAPVTEPMAQADAAPQRPAPAAEPARPAMSAMPAVPAIPAPTALPAPPVARFAPPPPALPATPRQAEPARVAAPQQPPQPVSVVAVAVAPVPAPAPAPVPPAAPPVAAPATAAEVTAQSNRPSMADVQPLLGQVMGVLQSGRGEQVLQWVERPVRQGDGADGFVQTYNRVAGRSASVRLASAQFSGRPAGDQLVVDGVVLLNLQDENQRVSTRELVLRAQFASRGGQAVLTQLSASEIAR